MPETQLPDSDRDDALFRSLLLRLAAFSADRLSSRTVLALKSCGMLLSAKASPLAPEIVAFLKNKDLSRRVDTTPGPLVFISVGGANRAVLDMMEYLLSEDVEIRRAVIQHFRELGEKGLLTKPNQLLFAAQQETSLSDRAWQASSIQLYDAIQNDYLCALAGLRQSLEMEFDEGVNNLLPRLTRPNAISIQMIGATLIHPARQQTDLDKEILELSNSNQSIFEIASKYFERFGHLPLAGSRSLASAIGAKLQTFHNQHDTWNDLWSWADSTGNPICRYHVCQVFCNYPNLIPRERLKDFWNEVRDIVAAPDELLNKKWERNWLIRCELSRHFYNYLMCAMPGVDGDAIAVASMWLSERLATAFGSNMPAMQEIVSHELDFSNYVRTLVHLPCGPSTLQSGIELVRSLWSLSLLCQLQPVIQQHGVKEGPSDAVEEIQAALHVSVLSMFPWQPKESSCLYSFDSGVIPTAMQWVTSTGETDKAALLPGLLAVTQQLRDCENIAKELSSIIETNETYQSLAAAAFRSWIYASEGNFDRLWEMVSEPAWGAAVVGKLGPRALELVFGGLNEARSRGGEKWNAYLPHLFAVRIQSIRRDDDRNALLFALTIMASLSSNSFSAIYRLVGSTSLIQREWIDRWRKNLEPIQQIVPSWISGRIGSLLLAFDNAAAIIVSPPD